MKFYSLKSNQLILSIFILALSSNSNASVIYDVENLGANNWKYSYIVVNDALPGQTIQLVEFTYDALLYNNVTPVNLENGWSDAGFNGFLHTFGGVGFGESLGGISVSFEYLGTDTPGSVPYQFVAPFSPFPVMESGDTELAAVPLPSSGILMISALAGLLLRIKKKVAVIA